MSAEGRVIVTETGSSPSPTGPCEHVAQKIETALPPGDLRRGSNQRVYGHGCADRAVRDLRRNTTAGLGYISRETGANLTKGNACGHLVGSWKR